MDVCVTCHEKHVGLKVTFEPGYSENDFKDEWQQWDWLYVHMNRKINNESIPYILNTKVLLNYNEFMNSILAFPNFTLITKFSAKFIRFLPHTPNKDNHSDHFIYLFIY